MRIVVLGDSMAMPRREGEDCVWWEETWPYLLQQNLVKDGLPAEVINCSLRARTADTLSAQDFFEHVELKRPTILIMEVGVVDCSPRVFSKREKKILNFPLIPAKLRDVLIKIRTDNRGKFIKQEPLAKVYTPPQQFQDCLRFFFSQIRKLDQEICVIAMPIVANFERMEIKSPGYFSNAELYNRILETWCAETGAVWIKAAELIADHDKNNLFGSDGYHFSVTGHRKVAEYLCAFLRRRDQGAK